ncbi:hypothetical protein [Microbispora sp. NPDC046933]|uniref:hypothetical protein n=1 Tax=Microbispora sp. NPDC046933 TaxID=3155618 RepID=UPI0033CDB5A8
MEIWHADALGEYSGFVGGNGHSEPDDGTFLRGAQITDAKDQHRRQDDARAGLDLRRRGRLLGPARRNRLHLRGLHRRHHSGSQPRQRRQGLTLPCQLKPPS